MFRVELGLRVVLRFGCVGAFQGLGFSWVRGLSCQV